jgi:hypothetical protein
MSIEWITILMFGGMLALLMLGLPLAFVTGLIGTVFCVALFGLDGLQLIASRIYSFVGEYVLVSVPMFVMMASIMERSGVAKDLFDAMRVWAGRLPGGLAMQTMVAATLMGAMTGIIGGEIVLLGLIALPQMLRLGYDKQPRDRHDLRRRLARHDDPAVHRADHLRPHGERADRRSVHREHRPRADAVRCTCSTSSCAASSIPGSARRRRNPSADPLGAKLRAAQGPGCCRCWSSPRCSAPSTPASPR